MKTPTFDERGIDRQTFAPFWVVNADDAKGHDISLMFHDWDWFVALHHDDKIDGYYFNGYGVEGIIKAVRHAGGRAPESAEVEFDSEADMCVVYFKSLEEALWTAERATDAFHSEEKLGEMIQVAREQGWED